MVDGRWLLAVLFAAALSGCVEAPANSGDANQAESDSVGEVNQFILGFAEEAHFNTDSITYGFSFNENQQFVGSTTSELGVPGPVPHIYDVSELLPDGGLFEVILRADSDPGSGDIDTILSMGDALISRTCDCPFGGTNELRAYGLAPAPFLEIGIQYDEISSGPDDPGFAIGGFDYTLDVEVRAVQTGLPAGAPAAVRLAPGDAVSIVNHTEAITIYDPRDQVVESLDVGSGEFVVDEDMPAGDYVMIQQQNGAMADVFVQTGSETPPASRLLQVGMEHDRRSFGPAAPAKVTFEAPASVIGVAACAQTGTATVQPDLLILRPDGETWVAASATVQALPAWSGCYSNWIGSPDQMPGTWTVEMTETAGLGITLQSWYYHFIR